MPGHRSAGAAAKMAALCGGIARASAARRAAYSARETPGVRSAADAMTCGCVARVGWPATTRGRSSETSDARAGRAVESARRADARMTRARPRGAK